MLKIFDALPEGFLDAQPDELLGLLGGPSLIHLRGRRQPALFLSVLLHGNEPTGFMALQTLLKRYADEELPRALTIFVGNVSAAEQGLRRLEGQPDYNRVWHVAGDLAEHQMMEEVRSTMQQRGVFASIDIHNNTGINPHYACINSLDNSFLQLASLFSRSVVYFIRPEGVQSMAFAGLCPSVTLECGQPGQAHGVEHAVEYIDACLNLAELSTDPVARNDVSVFHTVAIVTVPDEVSFSFGPTDVQLQFIDAIDHFNFSEMVAGTCFGWQRDPAAKLLCIDEHGCDVSDRYFEYEDGEIRLASRVMPSMLTLNERVIRQDCFCYLMERMELEQSTDVLDD